MGQVLLHIIVSNMEKKDMPIMCDVMCDLTEDLTSGPSNATKKQKELKQKDKKKSDKGKSSKKACKEPTKKEAVSLQINLQRTDTAGYGDIVKSVEQWMSDCPRCIYIVMTVSDMNSLHKVTEKLRTPHKGSSSLTNWLPSLLGKRETEPEASPSDSYNAPVKDVPVICICGNSDAIREANLKIDKIHVSQEDGPEKLCVGDSTDPHNSPVPVRHSKYLKVPQEGVDQGFGWPRAEEVCTVLIPTTCLRGLDERALKDALKPVIQRNKGYSAIQLDKGHLRCSVPFENLKTAVLEVVEVINSSDRMSQERGVSTSRVHEKTSMKERTTDVLNYEAMQYLLGDTFTDCVTNKVEKDGKVTFSVKSDKHVEDIDEKINSLREEIVPVEETVLPRLESLINVKSEGVEAFMKVLQQERKVAILCFDYNNMKKAQHLLKVMTGQVKTTSRGNRSFVEGSPPNTSQQSSSPSQPADCLDLKTESGIKVSVYKTDITKLPVDAIVNAANERLQHGGGVAAAIARAAGVGLNEEGDEYIRKHGPLKVTQVVATKAGGLPCKSVLHAVGPRWDDYQDKEQCQQDLERTVFNCLETASRMKLGSLAVSSISSAIFKVPKKVCAEAYLQAVQRFDEQYGARSCLRQIHFVDISDVMISRIQEVFSQKLSSVLSGHNIQHNREGSGQMVTSVTQQIRTDRIQPTASVNRRQRDETETTQLDVYVNDKQQSTADDTQAGGSFYTPQHKATDKTHPENVVDIPQQNVSQANLSHYVSDCQSFNDKTLSTPAIGSSQQNMLHKTESVTCIDTAQQSVSKTYVNTGPVLTMVPNTGTLGGHQWQFQFPELDLVIYQEFIFNMSTDAILFWHVPGKAFDDRPFTVFELTELNRKKWTEGDIHILQSRRKGFPCVAVVAVPPFNTDSAHAFQQIMEKALEEVDFTAKVKSLTVPRFPCTKDTKMDTDSIPSVIYTAVVQFAGRPKRSVHEIHVVDPNIDYIHAVVDNISSYAGLEKSFADCKRPEDPNTGILGGHQWQFQFPGLDLVIYQEFIFNMSTDAILFWHVPGKAFDDRPFTVFELTELNRKKWTEGDIHILQSRRKGFPCVAVVAVPPFNTDSAHAFQQIMEKALEKVDFTAKVKSLTVPRFPCTKDTKMDTDSIPSVIYTAVVQFAGRPKRSVHEIHVVDPNIDYIHAVVDNISSYAGLEKSFADCKRPEDPNRSLSARVTTSGQCCCLNKHRENGCNASKKYGSRESYV